MWLWVWAACALPECASDLKRVDPPVFGGGVEVLADGETAVAIDVETSRLVTIDARFGQFLTETVFPPRSLPFRIAHGRGTPVYVTLRGSGELASVDPVTGDVERTVDVCPAPRGVAVDADGSVLVACAGGELVTVAEDGTSTTRFVAPDLRDVVVDDHGVVWVSTFRAAQLIAVDEGLSFGLDDRIVTDALGDKRPYRSGVAWRMRARPSGGVDVLHRLAVDAPVDRIADVAAPGAVSCGGDVLFGISSITLDGVTEGPVIDSALAVDFAPTDDGWAVAELALWSMAEPGGDCTEDRVERHPGHAVAADGGDGIRVLRNPFTVTIGSMVAGEGDPLTREARSGLQGSVCRPPGSTPSAEVSAFHGLPDPRVPPCAACHPEGGDDGTVWDVVDHGLRRTPPLNGGLSGTEPLHWDGEFADLAALLAFQVPTLALEPDGLLDWLDAIDAPAATADADPAGWDLADQAGCLGCHGIDDPSVPGSFDVGTGGLFQVPRLRGVSLRLPVMHDGCAVTLHDRFDPACGGDAHGDTADLTDAEIDTLVGWLGSL